MTHRRPKRRALSDIEHEQSTSSPNRQQSSSTSSRRKSSERQARLIPFPFLVPSSYLDVNNLTTNGYNLSSQQIQQQQQINSPQTTNDSIYFTLPPNTNLPFNFTIDSLTNAANSGGRRKISMLSNYVNQISFMINQASFFNCSLPADLTNYVVNGTNVIVFSTIGIFQPICIQLKMVDQVNIEFDINTLMHNIVNNQCLVNNIDSNSGSCDDCCNLMNIDEVIDISYLIDPISQEQRIDIPVRGQQCRHYRCFDLRTFLERANYANNWNCPCCGQFISAQDLRADRQYIARTEEKLQENAIQAQQLNEQQQNITAINLQQNQQPNGHQVPHIQHDDIFEDFLDGSNLDDVFSENYY